jgi:serine protease inhibitor
MKDMNVVVEEAIEKATKGKLFTLKRIVIAGAVAAAVTAVVVVAKTIKKSHDDQEVDHEEIVALAEKAATDRIKEIREKKAA